MKNVLTVKNLKITAKETGAVIVKDSSFEINIGESTTILGQSGCGKTMTCMAIMGLLDKEKFGLEGSIRIDGCDVMNISDNDRHKIYGSKIVMIPQNPMSAFDPSVKIGKQMDQTLKIHTSMSLLQRKEKIITALKQSGLSETERVYKSYPYMLSGGMLQRVLIAMGLLTDARLVVADEPTTALDVIHKNETIDTYINLRDKRKCGILMVTHEFSSIQRLRGHLIVMKEGKIIERGNSISLLQWPKHEYTAQLIAASSLWQLRRNGESDVESDKYRKAL